MRAKKRREEVEEDRFNELRGIVERQQQQIDEIRGVRQPAFDIAAGSSQRKSSVADSHVPAYDARMIDGGPGYPVDGIEEQTPCELHDMMKNLSVKVTVGFAFPPSAKATWPGDSSWLCSCRGGSNCTGV